MAVEIDLTGHESSTTWDIFGGAEFPPVGSDGNLTLTIGTQSFYWLHIGDAPRA
ncbi:MAG: alpha-glucosidase C-terminal domain-containing protein [Rhodoglobus sp.]|nr:alpha-glucosidase C-terminal domain-containing protein [Rhodoglobus sp.]